MDTTVVSTYCPHPKRLRDDGQWVMLAFHNIAADGSLIGSISDPMPVRWEGQDFWVVS